MILIIAPQHYECLANIRSHSRLTRKNKRPNPNITIVLMHNMRSNQNMPLDNTNVLSRGGGGQV